MYLSQTFFRNGNGVFVRILYIPFARVFFMKVTRSGSWGYGREAPGTGAEVTQPETRFYLYRGWKCVCVRASASLSLAPSVLEAQQRDETESIVYCSCFPEHTISLSLSIYFRSRTTPFANVASPLFSYISCGQRSCRLSMYIAPRARFSFTANVCNWKTKK